MPHLIVEYSENLEKALDMSAFCKCLRVAATAIEAFPNAGIRVRAFPARHYAIADGNPAHGFIDISVRLRAGRTEDVKKAAVDQLFAAATEFVGPYMDNNPLALSLEMRDIDPELSPKTGSIRAHLKENQDARS